MKLGVVLVASGILLGRLTGLLREIALANSFGLSREADLAVFAMTLPDLLTNLLVGGAVAAVLIPLYHTTEKELGEEEAVAMVGRTFVFTFVGSSVATLLLLAITPWIVAVVAPGFGGTDADTARHLSWISLLAFPFSVLAAVATALLQIRGRMFSAVAGTLVFNVVALAVLLITTNANSALTWAAWSVVLGALIRLVAALYWVFRDTALRCFLRKSQRSFFSWALARSYAQALTGIGLVICFPVVARAVATNATGDVAALNYSLKLMDVPIGILSTIIGIVLLPRFSQLVQSNQVEATKDLLVKSIGLLGGVSLLAGSSVFLCGESVVGLLFNYGENSEQLVEAISCLVMVLGFMIPFSVLSALFTTLFHAQRDTRGPLLHGAAAMVVLIFLATWLYTDRGSIGIAIAMVISYSQLATTLGLSCFLRLKKQPVPLLLLPQAR
jgi:putative peptidoglycan lipid II flippase